jgi:hypothetical protein
MLALANKIVLGPEGGAESIGESEFFRAESRQLFFERNDEPHLLHRRITAVHLYHISRP